MSRNTLIVIFIIGLVVIAIMMTHHAAHAADHHAVKPHGWNMEHCMPGMDAHCRMNQAMGQMEKEMGEHRTMQHCMPNMTAHCQAIADLEYMEKRMENMRINMQHCMGNEKNCPMPEMSGEMKAMRDRMDVMSKEMQDKMQLKHDEKGQIDTQHERAESHEKGIMSDEFHQHERERNIQ